MWHSVRYSAHKQLMLMQHPNRRWTAAEDVQYDTRGFISPGNSFWLDRTENSLESKSANTIGTKEEADHWFIWGLIKAMGKYKIIYLNLHCFIFSLKYSCKEKHAAVIGWFFSEMQLKFWVELRLEIKSRLNAFFPLRNSLHVMHHSIIYSSKLSYISGCFSH